MKKIITLLAIVGMIVISSCEGPQGIPGQDGFDGQDGLMAEAFEIKNVDLAKVTDNEYNLYGTFNNKIGGDLFNDETVLVYRLTDVINTIPVWQLIPRTINFSNGDVLEYYFDFSKVDFIITAYGNFNLLNSPEYIDNQTFRIVILPSNLAASVDKNNYSAVMSSINLKEGQVQKMEIK